MAHRVKQAVVQKAAENGVDLSAITSPVPHSSDFHAKVRKPCDYMSTYEVSKVIGQPVERESAQENMCLYYGPPGLAAKLAEERMSGAMKKAEGGQSMEVSDFESMDEFVKKFAPEMVHDNGETPLLMIVVNHDGREAFTALAASNAIFSGIFKAAEAKGISFSHEVPGLGDKALRMPKLGLNVLKGDVVVSVMPGPIADSNAKSIQIARTVLERL